jgi:hypothetical protein
MTTTARFKTISEEYFADYLDCAKHRWVYEPDIPGQTKKPDFELSHSGVDVLCEVKQGELNDEELEEYRLEMEAIADGEPDRNAGLVDPVRKLRHLIDEGRRTFASFDGHLCALVVYNNGHRDALLDPLFIFWALLGNLAVRATLNVKTCVVDRESLQYGFGTRGGALVRKTEPLTLCKSLKNISAVVALASYRIPNPLFAQARDEEMRSRSAQLGRPLTGEERAKIFGSLIISGMEATIGDAWGLTVCTNPPANIPFPDDLFNGPFDARWSMVNNEMTRVFVGEQRLALDQLDGGNDDE